MTGAPVPVRVLCARTIANVSPGLSRALSLDPGQNSIALLATDCDDVTYLALDEATKAANVSGSIFRTARSLLSSMPDRAAAYSVPSLSCTVMLSAPETVCAFVIR